MRLILSRKVCFLEYLYLEVLSRKIYDITAQTPQIRTVLVSQYGLELTIKKNEQFYKKSLFYFQVKNNFRLLIDTKLSARVFWSEY